jgi:hypothetical protein
MISLRVMSPLVMDSPVRGRQHLKLVGPGQRFEAMLPEEHWEVKRQLPPVPHEGLVQHLMLAGVPGQALLM